MRVPMFDPDRPRPWDQLRINMERYPEGWREIAQGAEIRLLEWLGVREGNDVLLTNRCTYAMRLAFEWLRGEMGEGPCAQVEKNTYCAGHIAPDIPGVWVIKDEYMSAGPGGRAFSPNIIYSPVVFGGQHPFNGWFDKASHLVYDMAQSIGERMYTTMPVLKRGQFTVHSFNQNKQMGWFGGGLLVGDTEVIRKIRMWARPPHGLNNPHTGQAAAILAMLDDTFFAGCVDPYYRRINRDVIPEINAAMDRFGLYRVRWCTGCPMPSMLFYDGPQHNKVKIAGALNDMGIAAQFRYADPNSGVPLAVPCYTKEVSQCLIRL